MTRPGAVGWIVTAAGLLPSPASPQAGAPSVPPTAPVIKFTETTDESGLGAFKQVNGDADKSHISGANGGGLALFDYDDDGDLDVFFVSGSRMGGLPAGQTATNRLYRNLGGGRFEDVTQAAGLDSHSAFGQGCAVADVNGDDALDLFVANIGVNALYINRKDGTFVESAAKAGLAAPGWSSGASFFDYDQDGDLDLYVTRYLRLEPGEVEHGPKVTIKSDWKRQSVFKGPHELTPAADSLYRNNGDGTFTDVTKEAGMADATPSYGFEPLSVDFDGDGDTDLFVANDSKANFLWRNNHDGTFTDVALVAGVAFNANGRPQSNMGVTCDDYDNDGKPDIFITTFSDDAKTLFRNAGKESFNEVTTQAGLASPDVFRALSWGTSFFDVDDDGDLDLFFANGHVYPQADRVGAGYSYAQRPFLFVQRSPGRFVNGSDEVGASFRVAHPARGSAAGDIDDDGDLDLVINNLDTKPTVLRNDTAPRGHFAKVKLRGKGNNRAAIGACVTLVQGTLRQLREVRSSGSYLSHEDLRIHFGLGDSTKIDRIEVRWPDGATETVPAPPADQLLWIEQGKGLAKSSRIGS